MVRCVVRAQRVGIDKAPNGLDGLIEPKAKELQSSLVADLDCQLYAVIVCREEHPEVPSSNWSSLSPWQSRVVRSQPLGQEITVTNFVEKHSKARLHG